MATKTAKKAGAKAIAPEVVEQESPDLRLVQTDGSEIQRFIGNIVAFFRDATALEQKAKATHAQAISLVQPATEEADVVVQTFIKATRADLKAAGEFWGICQVFSAVHRKLTAARARTTDPLEAAAARAQSLHNIYAERERQRVAAEQEKYRLAAEAKAREDRDRELASLDAEAVRREEAMQECSEREQAFVTYYATGWDTKGNGQLSAERAGFREPFKTAARLLSLPKIQTAIKAKTEAETVRTQRTAIAEKPLDVQTETVRPNIGRPIGGGHDRTTHSAELVDEAKLIAAVIAGGYGIPSDVLTVNPAKLNEYARSLQGRINLWPGVRYKKNTTTV